MKSFLNYLSEEIKVDVNFVKSHTLQPKWYKVLKVFILIGFLVGYSILFGLPATLIFLVILFTLAALIHMVYRVKTRKWTHTWLDFVIVEEDNQITMKRIGKFYYSAILVSVIISIIVSQVLIWNH